MSHEWDEFSKSLAEPVARRESLRRLGLVIAGTVLSPLGLQTAWARGPDPCKAFCNQCPKSRRSQCQAACKACGNDPRFLCGSCAAGYTCTDLADDPYNCGACGHVCDEPGPYEYGACIDGECRYACAEGAVRCNGSCTFLGWDPDNCGACGHVCGGQTPFCSEGECSDCPGWMCGGLCVNLLNDPDNCGACGVVCGDDENCAGGVCQSICIPDCPAGWCGDDGCGGRCGCPDGEYCPAFSNWCAVSEPTDF
jgi:hypothetical protein